MFVQFAGMSHLLGNDPANIGTVCLNIRFYVMRNPAIKQQQKILKNKILFIDLSENRSHSANN